MDKLLFVVQETGLITENEPMWPGYIILGLLVVMAAVLLSGHGGWMVAGYNTLSAEKKALYDEKKVCRVTGTGLLVIDIMILVMLLFGKNLPDWFVYIALAVVVAVILFVIIGIDFFCKKSCNNSK